jgi:hypothetical protein
MITKCQPNLVNDGKEKLSLPPPQPVLQLFATM